MKELWEEFCQNSSLHGMHYLVGKGKTVTEKVLWSVLLAVVSVAMILSVYTFWYHLKTSSVLVVVENPQYDLALIEFPAVTICPNSKAMKSKVQTVMKTYVKNEKDYDAFQNSVIALSLMRFPFYNLPQDYVASINQSVYHIPTEDIRNIMLNVGADLNDVIDKCIWRSIHYDCKYLFRRQLTDEGFCYSFNSKTAFRSKADSPLLPPLEMTDGTLVPFRSNTFSRNSGLGFRLKSLAHEKISNDDVLEDCYSIVIHNPAIIPFMSGIVTIVPKHKLELVQMNVYVSNIEAGSSLYSLEESVRNCSFANGTNGRRLCQRNCRDLTMLHYCQCLPYYQHSENPHPVCGMQHLQCLKDISPRLLNYRVFDNNPGFPNWSLPLTMNCSCLQPCGYTYYSSEVETLPRSLRQRNKHSIGVAVLYKNFGVKYSRTPKYAFRDFLINCGSMASLLLGFSAVAVFDLIAYFFKYLYRSLILSFSICSSKKTAHVPVRKKGPVILIRSVAIKRNSVLTNKIGTSSYHEECFNLHSGNESSRPLYPFLN